MSYSIIIRDGVTKDLQALETALAGPDAKQVIGRTAVNSLRARFFQLDGERANKLGGDRTHFYAQAARSTQFQPTEDGVRVSVNQVGIRQRLEGGTILPTGGRKYLTIPARAEAYGKRALSFSNLKVQFGKGGKPVALVEVDATALVNGRGKNKGKLVIGGTTGGLVMYWLVPSVYQHPDPTVVPTPEALKADILQALKKYSATLLQRGSAGASPAARTSSEGGN